MTKNITPQGVEIETVEEDYKFSDDKELAALLADITAEKEAVVEAPRSLSKGIAIYAVQRLQEELEMDLYDESESVCDDLNEAAGVVMSATEWGLAMICLLEQLLDG